MKRIKASVDQPGVAFERLAAAIQAQLDPAANVVHNEKLMDRLGHRRQFDVVVRGTFAGQQMLGVIECKDLKGRVGTPEVDAFVTKAQDVHANFKILMSRNGFTEPALEKCTHYGIQALSLLSDDPINKRFFIGTKWEADVTRWAQAAVSLHFVHEPAEPVRFSAEELTVCGKRVFDWFTNYLLANQGQIEGFGWVVNISVVFDTPQLVEVRGQTTHLCNAISFRAERVCDKLERLVGINGTGFYNWHAKQATFPSNTHIRSDFVPLDFAQWQPRAEQSPPENSFLRIKLEVQAQQFEHVADVIELDRL